MILAINRALKEVRVKIVEFLSEGDLNSRVRLIIARLI